MAPFGVLRDVRFIYIYIYIYDKGRNKQETRKKELFWQYKLDAFVPHGLNERVVDLEWI